MTSYFFVGIGGSGMLPLAEIVLARGAKVAGSDRGRDQGRSLEKFAALAAKGATLFPQDGSGPQPGQTLVASAAIEDSVSDIAAAARLGLPRLTRAELLAQLFNAAPVRIAVGGTSGKSTVTGMVGHILTEAGRNPTIMNGAVMKNFASASRVGQGDVFVSEVDESDSSIALYRPTIAVLNNVSEDHKSIAELRDLFANFLARSTAAAINVDDREARALPPRAAFTFGLRPGARLRGEDVSLRPEGASFSVNGLRCVLRVPGLHNVSNALAALAAAQLAEVPLADAVAALETFTGLARRFDVIGTANGVTVIDDFGHNPDKIAATLSTLHAFPGRLLVLFQPHGYGPLRLMREELMATLAAHLMPDDVLVMPDPVYFGGTTDRSVGSDEIVAGVRMAGRQAEHIPDRAACADRLLELARPGDRIVVMGARDDTLTDFARNLLARLKQ